MRRRELSVLMSLNVQLRQINRANYPVDACSICSRSLCGSLGQVDQEGAWGSERFEVLTKNVFWVDRRINVRFSLQDNRDSKTRGSVQRPKERSRFGPFRPVGSTEMETDTASRAREMGSFCVPSKSDAVGALTRRKHPPPCGSRSKATRL